jgi:acetyl esterase/lipase
MLAAGFKVSLEWGNLATLRLLLGVMANPALHTSLNIEKVQPPGCEPCYWLSLKHSSSKNSRSSSSRQDDDNRKQQRSRQLDIVLCYVHGGAFVAGHPLMCAGTFKRWMEALDRQGFNTQVLCISYPLAPERPFPAAVASTAAVFAWVRRQFPAGCDTTVIAVGDSAGGNIVPTSLAALRDYMQHKGPAPIRHLASGTAAAQHDSLYDDVGAPAGDTKHAAATPGSPPLPAGTSSSSVAGTGSSDDLAAALAAASSNGSSHAAALTAAIEAHLFADLHNRLTVMAANSSSSSATTRPSDSANSVLASTLTPQAADVKRMPSAIILVSPATDISPTACFRTHWPPGSNDSNNSSSSSNAYDLLGPTTQPAQAPTPDPSAAAAGSSSKRPHYDYLPENIESGGMGSYAAHHEQLCGPYASPVHLPSLQGLTLGRWLLLSGGVELLHPDIDR